jgi:hypothetical protein
MQQLEFWLRVLTVFISGLGVAAAIYNISSSQQRAKQLAKERHDADRLDQVILLAARTDQRVTGLEGSHKSLEARVDRRLEKIAEDTDKIKDLFTNYLIKSH